MSLALKSNWHRIALRAWSMWLLYASLAVQAGDAMMPYVVDVQSPSWVKVGAFIVTAAAAYVRMCPQRNLPEEANEGDRAPT